MPDILPAVLVAPLVESANTEEPLGWRLVKASAWIETNKSARCFWALLRALKRNEDVFIARHIHLHIALFLDQRAQTASYLQYHVFSRVLYFPTARSSPPWPGSSIMTIGRSRPALPGCGPLCAGGTCFRVAFVVILQQRQQRVLHILCIGRIEVHHQTLFKPGDRRKDKQLRFYVLL